MLDDFVAKMVKQMYEWWKTQNTPPAPAPGDPAPPVIVQAEKPGEPKA